ncbi:MAG: PEP/pyruvate-binding domain-containing protein, partial [Chthoniobacterales bacterium]
MDPIQNLRDCADVALVGGKAANLGALLRAGFVVPDGFVMTTAARDADLGSIRAAYRHLNATAVAVRSSATMEDTETASMAGQFKTILNVRNEAELVDAVQLCRSSLASPNSFVYPHEALMPLVIQSQVAADVAGVLFTQSPQNPDEMLIEAAPGLGDNVVSGRTQPDTFRVNRETGHILESRCHHESLSLTIKQVKKLWNLGRKVASHFGVPQDIEWAFSGDELFLLQARPITTSDRAVIRTNLIRATRERLLEPRRGPWVLHNLAETVPHPTPLTWSVLRKFMSGAGGFGTMYRRLGFDPAATEVLELVLGKMYLDLARAPGVFGKEFPFVYDAELLRRDPNATQLPPSLPRGSWLARFRANRQLREAKRKIDIESVDLDQRLRQQIIPRFTQWCAAERKRDLTSLSTEKWIALWAERERRLFDDFAPQILFTTFIAATALRRLQDFVAEHFWDDPPEALTQLFASSGQPDETLLVDAALREVARGQSSLGEWLDRYGHRGIGEFDLAVPRWREIPDALLAYAERLKNTPDPVDLHRKRTEQARQKINQLPDRAARELEKRIDLVRRYLVFREDGKHYLMLGYDLLRDLMLEASRRLGTDGAWLTADELSEALRRGSVLQPQIDQRRREFLAEARINLPQSIDASALSSLGTPPKFESHQRFEGLPISSGLASGPVRIVESPLDARDLDKDYVLVCPSTDPQWTPLFLNASALVLGCGGSLSHGAIVAREMNLPAIVLPHATQLLRENEYIFVDGSSGV